MQINLSDDMIRTIHRCLSQTPPSVREIQIGEVTGNDALYLFEDLVRILKLQ